MAALESLPEVKSGPAQPWAPALEPGRGAAAGPGRGGQAASEFRVTSPSRLSASDSEFDWHLDGATRLGHWQPAVGLGLSQTLFGPAGARPRRRGPGRSQAGAAGDGPGSRPAAVTVAATARFKLAGPGIHHGDGGPAAPSPRPPGPPGRR